MTEATRKFPLSFTKVGLRREVIDDKCFLPEVVEKRPAAIDRIRFTGHDDEELRCGCGFGAPEHRGGYEVLPCRVVGLGQFLRKRHSDRAH